MAALRTGVRHRFRRSNRYNEPLAGPGRVSAALARDAENILRGYNQQIIRDAWPQQRRGQIPCEGVDWMDRLQADLFTFEPPQSFSYSVLIVIELIGEKRGTSTAAPMVRDLQQRFDPCDIIATHVIEN
jgi:hypothetical protein